MRTRYRIWFSTAVACHGVPSPNPEKRDERKWCYKECPRQSEQSPILHIGPDRAATQSPHRNHNRCKVRYSDALIDPWDAKGTQAADNETKKRDGAEKDVAYTADGIHWDLIN